MICRAICVDACRCRDRLNGEPFQQSGGLALARLAAQPGGGPHLGERLADHAATG